MSPPPPNMPMPLIQQQWYTPDELARKLGVSVRTLAHWRLEGRGPRFGRVSYRSIKYTAEDVEQWVQFRREERKYEWQSTTSRPQRARPRRHVALPVQREQSGAQRQHRFGRHQTKSEAGRKL